MILDSDEPFIIIRGEQVMGAHRCLDDAISDARYLASIEPEHRFQIVEASKVLTVHNPCDVK